MEGLFKYDDKNLLVGPGTSDDAGIYRIGPDCALVETADIITPLVDDPFTFGRIAAANAVSDVYAMGGRPVTAMNLVFFPSCSLPEEVLGEILAGGQSILQEAGVCLVGGHTVEDDELKYGLSITGLISPEKIIRNSTARPGDMLVLTKPLGTGIISTTIKAELASAASVAEAEGWMTKLNRDAADLMLECYASAATDVTGFGLLGHSCEMARGAGVSLRLQLGAVPLMSGISKLVDQGLVPGGCYRNRDHYSPMCKYDQSRAEELLPLFDPQTSGGLLIALSPRDAQDFLTKAAKLDIFAVLIGEVLSQQAHLIELY